MRLLIILAGILTLTSCAANKYLSSSTTKSTEIKHIAYFHPLSYIQYIEKGNKAALSDSLSGITSENLSLVLDKNKPALRLDKEISILNDTVKGKMEDELAYLARLIFVRKKLSGIPIPHTIDSILKNNNQRFALATVATGFGRKKGNYRGQVAKGAAIGILTLGMAVPTPVKSNLTLHAFIFDAAKDEIAYYKKSMPVEKEPTDEQVIEKQLIKLFEGYFYGKN
jgi:hypothetical protein